MLIKSNQLNEQRGRAVVLDLGDVAEQARKLKEAAQAEAKQILERAHQQARELTADAEKKGHETGYAAGYDAGLNEGREAGKAEALEQMQKRLRKLDKQWSEAAETWEQQRTALERDARDAVLQVAMKLGEKIVHRTLETERGIVVDQLDAVLRHVLEPTRITVRAHPDDIELLRTALPELHAKFSSLEHVELVADEALTAGGCVVDHGHGRIDASIEKQLERLGAMLRPEAPSDGTSGVERAGPDTAGDTYNPPPMSPETPQPEESSDAQDE